MATKKYISPDVFPVTIRDNFRKAMGQHYIVDPTGISLWNPMVKKLDQPLTVGTAPAPTQIEYEGKTLSVVRKDQSTSSGNPATLTDEYGLTKDATTGRANLLIRVTADTQNYTSLSSFRESVENIFQNPLDGGFYFDRTFETETQTSSEVGTSATYNYLVEQYEQISDNLSENVLPNHYNINLLERTNDDLPFLIPDVPGNPNPDLTTIPNIFASNNLLNLLITSNILSYDVYEDNKDHTLLYGRLDPTLITEQGLLSESYLESDILEFSSLEDFVLSDLDRSTSIKYLNYFKSWANTYSNLTGAETAISEEKAKNIIFSYVGSLIVTEESTNLLPIQNKIPFYSKTVILSEMSNPLKDASTLVSYPTVAEELVSNNLVPTLGSHLASVFDRNYLDPAPPLEGPEYAASSLTFYDSNTSEDIVVLATPEMGRVDFGPENASFVSAITYWSSNFGTKFPSPETSFTLENKLFIDYVLDPSVYGYGLGESGLAITLSEDPVNGNLPTTIQATNISNFVNSTTQLADQSSGPAGIQSTANGSFSRALDVIGGRLYKESFEDGAPAHSETVMYKISKYSGSRTDTTPIQNIWLPNYTQGATKLEYIDSQVKYGEEYTYVVSAIKYVFGLKYKYSQKKAPGVAIVETVLEDAITIGYIVEWTGMANLFDDWEVAYPQAFSSQDPLWAIYANLFDPSYNYVNGDTPQSAPGFNDKNRYFLTIARLNEILETSWDLRPKSQYINSTYGFPQTVGFSAPSWRNIWGGDWIYDITPNTPVGEQENLKLLITTDEDGQSLSLKDPANFGVQDWLNLWFGAGTSIEPYYLPPGASTFAGNDWRVQWVPPAHHILDRFFGSVSNVTTVGFENYQGGTINSAKTLGSVESVEPGFGATTIAVNGYDTEYEINMQPATQIVEVPILTSTTSILSKPPAVPQIDIIPFRGINDTLLFNFASANIKTIQAPIPIQRGEEEMFAKLSQAQNKQYGEPIEFSNDDTISFFQIFRVDRPPTSYADFADSLRATISTLVSSEEEIVRATSASYEEKLLPNIKYYYTFRSVDYHGNFSNPTTVYEVELVDDAGAVFLLVNTYEFPIIDHNSVSIDMTRFLQVLPAIDQVTADVPSNTQYADPSDIPFVQLGADYIREEDRIWDKTFKIRLTSKETGKKIDFNVTFEKKDNRNK